MTDELDFYDILGVPQNASLDDIRHAYRALARLYHPDAQQEGATGTTLLFRQVQQAYEVLSDQQRRAAYNRRLAEAGFGLDSLFALNLQVSRDVLPVMSEEQI